MSLCGLMKKCIISPRKSNYYDCYDQENSNMLFGMSGFRTEKVMFRHICEANWNWQGFTFGPHAVKNVMKGEYYFKMTVHPSLPSVALHQCCISHPSTCMCRGGGDPAVFSDTSTFISKQQLLFFSQHSFYKRQNISTRS